MSYLLRIEADLVGPSRGGLDPLVADQAGQDVPQDVDSGLGSETDSTRKSPMRYKQLQRQTHVVRLDSLQGGTQQKTTIGTLPETYILILSIIIINVTKNDP